MAAAQPKPDGKKESLSNGTWALDRNGMRQHQTKAGEWMRNIEINRCAHGPVIRGMKWFGASSVTLDERSVAAIGCMLMLELYHVITCSVPTKTRPRPNGKHIRGSVLVYLFSFNFPPTKWNLMFCEEIIAIAANWFICWHRQLTPSMNVDMKDDAVYLPFRKGLPFRP